MDSLPYLVWAEREGRHFENGVGEDVIEIRVDRLQQLVERVYKDALEAAALKHDKWSVKHQKFADEYSAEGRSYQAAFELTVVHVHDASANDLRAMKKF